MRPQGPGLRVFLALGCLALVLVAPPAGLSQPATPTSATPADGLKERVDQLQKERQGLQRQLEDARRALKDAGDNPTDALDEEVALLQGIDLLLAQEVSALKQSLELAERQAQLAEELGHLRRAGLPEAPPYSVVLLDEIQDEVDLAQAQLRSSQASVTATTEAVEQARLALEERDRSRRAAKEAVEVNTDPAQAPTLATTLRIAQLEARSAAEQLRLREIELTNETSVRDIDRQRLTTLQEKMALVAPDACLERDDLEKQVATVEKDETDLQRSLTAARRELETAERRMAMAQQRFDQESSDDPVRIAELGARRVALETLQLEVRGLTQRLQHAAQIKEVWNRRYLVSEEPPGRRQLNEWSREAQAAAEQLGREERVQRGRLAQLRQTSKAMAQSIVDNAAPAPEVARWLIEQQERLQEQSATYEALLTSLETARHLQEKLVGQIEQRTARVPLRERLREARDVARAAWNYELTAVDDRPITVGKIVLGVLLVSVGFWVARLLSYLLGKRVLPRLGLDPHAASALQSVVFYLLLSGLSLFVLNVINVPLTVFTFVGGALAIGVGFGSQNIVNNFISGLILLAERPIKVGDVISVDGTEGTVERIGPRSTRVLGSGNIDIIIPNSVFLERNVVNWTLSTDSIRTTVAVGVEYGSDVALVTSLLREAVNESDKVLKHPVPFVLFADFGADALQFEVHFWIRVRAPLDQKVVQSEVRYAINRLFARDKVSIAFPQTDVHLQASEPLNVRLLAKGDE